jgi:hypothetical protein
MSYLKASGKYINQFYVYFPPCHQKHVDTTRYFTNEDYKKLRPVTTNQLVRLQGGGVNDEFVFRLLSTYNMRICMIWLFRVE